MLEALWGRNSKKRAELKDALLLANAGDPVDPSGYA